MSEYVVNPFSAPPAYEETVIVNFIERRYNKLLILICYIDADNVAYAPPDGHAIDENLCSDLGYDARVVSLMKRLPYFTDERKVRPIFSVRVLPLIYTQEDHLRTGRSPFNFMLEPEDMDDSHLPAHGFAFFSGSTRDLSWILDVEESTIRQVDPMCNYVPDGTLRGPTDHHFAVALSAPHLLGKYISQLRTLFFMPMETQLGIFDVGGQAGRVG